MIDAPLYIANTEATLRAIVLASKVAKMIDRKHRQALAISSEKKTNSSYQYELISPFDEINRMVKTSALGGGDDAVSNKIRTLRKEGYPIKQAVAIALDMKRRGDI